LTALVAVGPRPKASESSNPNPFADRKVQIDFDNLARQGAGVAQELSVARAAKAFAESIPRDAELVALVDTQCVADGNGGAVSHIATEGKTASLQVQAYKWRLREAKRLRELAAEAEEDPCVIGVTENIKLRVEGEFTNDTYFSRQAHFAPIEAEESYDLFWGSSLRIDRDVVIAIIDTGVAYSHPDLKAQMWRNASGQYGIDFVNDDNDPNDDHGHGTHVAGLAAATGNNNIGVSGVMGFRAKIMAIKTMGADGAGDLSDVANGIIFATQNGANVINLSLGGPGQNTLIRTAIQDAVNAGVFVTLAAGNDGVQLTNTTFYVPASYGVSLDGALTVGAFDTGTLDRPAFSNFSTTFVEIGAPGSTGNTGLPSTYIENQYVFLRGTSMAAPVVAGAAALAIGLLRTHNVTPRPADIENILKNSASKSTALGNDFVGGNRLNVLRIARYIQNSYIFDGSSGLENE
jgi:subtilisin family serine protease